MAERYRTGTSSRRWATGEHEQGCASEEPSEPLMFYMHSSSPAARFIAAHLLEKGAHDEREELWEEWELGCPFDRQLRDYCADLVPTAGDRTLAEAKELQRQQGAPAKRSLEDDLLVPANRANASLLAILAKLEHPSQKNTYRRLLLDKVQLFWVRRRGKFPFHHQRAISDHLDAAEADAPARIPEPSTSPPLAGAGAGAGAGGAEGGARAGRGAAGRAGEGEARGSCTQAQAQAQAEAQAEMVLQLSYRHRVVRRPMRVLVNHLPSELFLTQKGMLVRCLTEAYGEEGYSDVHPHTVLFVLDKPPPYNNRALRSLYCSSFTVHNLKSRLLDGHCLLAADGEAGEEEPLLWIVKPAIGSCGRGIQILDLTAFRARARALALQQRAAEAAVDEQQCASAAKALTEDVYARLREVVQEYRDESGTELVVQHYVHRPLLYRGYKFDLRVYVLLASIERPFLALYSTEGYLRVCSDLYQGSGYSNRNAHVTNFHVQREHPLYDAATDSIQGQTTRVSYEEFLDYLQEVAYEVAPVSEADGAQEAADAWAPSLVRDLRAGGVAEEDLERTCRGGGSLLQRAWTEHLLHRQIRRVVGKAVAAAVGRMQADEHTCVGQFGLLGVDLLLDTDGQVWLIEFTKSPAFRFQPPYLADLHSRLLRDAVDIPIEVEQVRACLPDVRQAVPLDALSRVRTSKSWAILPTPLPPS